MDIESLKHTSKDWFRELRNQICAEFESIEQEFDHSGELKLSPATFERTYWDREDNPELGGGEISLMRGRVFEKVGVNISTVHGEFSEKFRKEIPGASDDGKFWASGISLVAHMRSPIVPAIHMNTRFISTTNKSWFGGGADLTPMLFDKNKHGIEEFHKSMQRACDSYSPACYNKYKEACDDYFYLKHRDEARGAGGIFVDYLDEGSREHEFEFIKNIGKEFLKTYPEIIRHYAKDTWTADEREYQLNRRGRYVEYNLLYDRGTRFGLMTGGNTEAILMSLPPEVKW